ncbi:MAG: PAS domain S-box protein [Chloroflexota bacterium]|nr:PAS domain S-box protein [Chloroflexota bacterium]
MPARINRLGLKLMLITLVALVLLAAATAGLVTRGFRQTQREVTGRSAAGLEAQGREALVKLAERETELTAAALGQGVTASQSAARYLGEMIRLGGAAPADPGRLTRGRGGQYLDPDPARRSDIFIPNSVPAVDAALERDLRESAALDAIFPALLAGYEDAVAVYYITPQGLTRSYPLDELADVVPPDYRMTDNPSYLIATPEANPGRGTVWRAPYVDPGGQGVLVTASTPVYVGDEFRGVIGVALSLDRLIAGLNALKPTPTGYAFLTDGEGRLMAASTPALRDLTGLNLTGSGPAFLSSLGVVLADGAPPDLRATLEAMRAGRRGVDRINLGGRPVFVAYAPLENVGWRLALVAPISEITAQSAAVAAAIGEDAGRTIDTTLATICAIFLLTLLATALVSHRLLTRPIAALVAGTRAIGAGDLGVRLPVTARDELGGLAAAFNRMTAQLAATRGHLEQRTAELTRTNAALETEVVERRRVGRELRERESQYRGIFEATGDGLVITDLDGTVVEANPAMCRMHGYEREDLLGLPLTALIRPDDHPLFEGYVGTVRSGRQFQARAVAVRRDGTPLHVEVHGTGFTFREEPHVLGVLRDVTGQVQAYETLEGRVAERTRELTTLLDISHNVASTLELQPLLGLILDQLRTVVEYDGASIVTLEGEEFVQVEYRGALPREQVLSPRVPVDRTGAVWERFSRREPIFIPDIWDDNVAARECRRLIGEERLPAAGGLRCWLGVPLAIKERTLGILSLTHHQAGYYTAAHARLVTAIATQAAVAIENARLYSRAQELAALEERQRLARELHDSVSQALYGIALGARTARTLLDRDPGRVAPPLDYVLSLAEAGLAEMRALIFELRPESLATEGLVAALTKQAASLRARHNIEVAVDLCDEPEVPLERKEALYRIAQEALHNTVKHARAGKVGVRMRCDEREIALEIRDDGVGFDPTGSFPGHLGLRSMRERAARLGGTVAIESAPGRGTRLCAHIPLARAA